MRNSGVCVGWRSKVTELDDYNRFREIVRASLLFHAIFRLIISGSFALFENI